MSTALRMPSIPWYSSLPLKTAVLKGRGRGKRRIIIRVKKLDKFVLKAFIGPFVAILLIVVFILMMQFLWLYIDELVGKGLGMKVILEFMMWGTCTILPLALPLATLLSSMMTFGQMAENKELMAIKASGVSLVRVMFPLMVVSALIALGAFFVGNNLVPKAFKEIYQLRTDIGKTKSEIKIPSGTFYDGIDGYVLRVEDQKDGMMYSVMVYDHTGKKGNTSVTLADSATMRLSKAKDYLIFTLYDGINYQEDNKWKGKEAELQLNKVAFQKQQLVIPLAHYAFEKSDTNTFGNQTKAQRVQSLIVERDSLSGIIDASYREHRSEVARASYFSFPSQLDSSSFDTPRKDFEYKNFGVWFNRKDKIRALKNAASKADRIASDMQDYDRENYSENYYLRRTSVEILKKFAQALACFILFFIGAPLGALIGKGGLGVSAIISVLFFVLYWVVDISGTKLANDGAIPPSVGAFISAYVLAPIGAYLTWKAVHDSTFSSGDSFKIGWRKFRSKFLSLFRKTRIVYMGTPEFAVAPLDALLKRRYRVVAVVTAPDKAGGRGLKIHQSPVKQYALEHGIPVLQPVKLKDPEFIAQLKSYRADLFVVVAFRMLPEVVWTMPRLGTFNLHAALLPQYRGAAPINWALINGERLTGVTSFMIDKNIDTGGIILREECRITPEETAGELHDALIPLACDVVLRTVEGIVEGNVETRVQRSFIQGDEVLKGAPKLTAELLDVDWRDSAASIHNLIRGLSPSPAAFTYIRKGEDGPQKQLKFFASMVGEKTDMAPGTIESDGKTYLRIAASDAFVDVLDVQLEGKKRMAIADFLRGFRNPQEWVALCGTSKEEKNRLCSK